MSELSDRVTAVIRMLGPGEVVSYGDVAETAGFPGRARAVGQVLSRSTEDLPWWRVVHSSGHLAQGKTIEQADRLRREGVQVLGDRVSTTRFRRSAETGRSGRSVG